MTHNLLSINLVPRHSYTSDSLYLDGKNRAVLRSFRPQTGPAPKRDTTQRPPLPQQRLLFFIAGPLAARQIAVKFALYLDFRRARKSFEALPCNRPFASKHMLFCLRRLRHQDNFIITRQLLLAYLIWQKNK